MTDHQNASSAPTGKQDSPIAGDAAQRPPMTSEEMLDRVKKATGRFTPLGELRKQLPTARRDQGPGERRARATRGAGDPATRRRRARGPRRHRAADGAAARVVDRSGDADAGRDLRALAAEARRACDRSDSTAATAAAAPGGRWTNASSSRRCSTSSEPARSSHELYAAERVPCEIRGSAVSRRGV